MTKPRKPSSRAARLLPVAGALHALQRQITADIVKTQCALDRLDPSAARHVRSLQDIRFYWQGYREALARTRQRVLHLRDEIL